MGEHRYWASTGARAAVQASFGTSNIVSYNLALSANGQHVAFQSVPVSLAGSAAGVILRYNLQTGATDLIHTNANATIGSAAFEDIHEMDLSPDGRFVAFVANTNDNTGETTCVLVWDAQSGLTTLGSADLNGGVQNYSASDWPTLTPDGHFVAFLSSAPDLVTNDLAGDEHLYIRDLQAATTTLVDTDANGIGAELTSMPVPWLSADGRFVAFECLDGKLVANDRNNAYDVFGRDLITATTELISAHDPALPSLTPNGSSTIAALASSADGRWVTFASDADNLVANDTNLVGDIFLRDLLTGSNILVSVSTNGLPADGLSSEPALSSSGRYVAFTSRADDLVAGDTNYYQDVFLRDLQSGQTTLVSVSSNGVAGNADSFSPVLSSDGQFVLFRSRATNLVPGPFNGAENLFLRDVQGNRTYALTTLGVSSSSMTPDARLVAFLGVPLPNWRLALYVWDLQAAAPIYTNSSPGITATAIGPDGRWVISWQPSGIYAVDWMANTNQLILSCFPLLVPTLRFSSDSKFLTFACRSISAPIIQVYVYDFQGGTNLLVSRSWSTGGMGNGGSDSPDISPDGQFIAYRSEADDIVPGDTNGVPDIFLYDRLSGNTTLVSASRFGSTSADNRSLKPVFSVDGRILFFESWASDLVANDFNFGSDVFAYSLYATNSIAPFSVSVVSDAQRAWITWPALAGKNYRVQFKNELSDPDWQEAAGELAIAGGAGYFRDLSATGATERFYRVVAY